MVDHEACGEHWTVGCISLFRASHLSGVSCRNPGVPLTGSSLPSVTSCYGTTSFALVARLSCADVKVCGRITRQFVLLCRSSVSFFALPGHGVWVFNL